MRKFLENFLCTHVRNKSVCTKTYSAHGKHVGHHTQMSCLASRHTKSHANAKCDEIRVNISCHTLYIYIYTHCTSV